MDPPPRSTKVRFHDEVRVKKIKARGRNLPVTTARLMGQMDEEDQDDEEFTGLMGEEDSSDEEEGDEEGSDEDDGDFSQHPGRALGWPGMGNDEDDSGDEDEEMGENEDDAELDSREMMGRLQNDLFAEDDEVQEDGVFTHFLCLHVYPTLTLYQNSPLTKGVRKPSRNRLQSSKLKTSPRRTGRSWERQPLAHDPRTRSSRKTWNSSVS